MKSPTCRYVEGQGNLLPTHRKDCSIPGCEGCQRCNERHCTMPRCSRHLADHEPKVCAKCVGKVRNNLRRIRELCTLVPVAAAERGVDTEPAVMAGPVADYGAYTKRHREVVHYGFACRCHERRQPCPDRETIEGPACEGDKDGECEHQTCRRLRGMLVCPDVLAWLDNADDDRHPLWVLGSWDMLVAEHLGHERTLRITVEGASRYLDRNLTDLARFEDFAFDELAREVKACLKHVEDVLALTPFATKGAPCPACRDAGRPAKRLERTYTDEDHDTHDEWVCPTKTCGKTLSLDEYDKYVYVDYLANADKLTAAQMTAQYRIPEGTLRRWANGWTDRSGAWHDAIVRKRGYDGERRQLYDVADTVAARDGDTLDSRCA